MKKILTLSLIALSLLSFKLKTIESLTAQDFNNQVQESSQGKENKGFFTDRKESFKAKRLGKKKNLEQQTYIEPKQCSMLTAVCVGIGCFLSGILTGIYFGLAMLFSCLPR